MGAGGQSTNPPRRTPYEKPPFKLIQLRKAIPPKCFERSLLHSFFYLLLDLIFAFILYYIANNYINFLPKTLSYLAWPSYWLIQGGVMTGIWVLAHECSHNAFSDYQWLDDTIGLILYSSLLVPYFSFKYSHRRHHANTGSLENDEVYLPRKKENLQWYFTSFFNNSLGRALTLIVTLTLGWSLYLLFNVSGRKYGRFASHYDPYGPITNKSLQVFISDAGVLTTFYVLSRIACKKGFAWLVRIYCGPLLGVNIFVVLITFLHHIHVSVPYYDSSEWSWLRGALSTIDRDYGTFFNFLFHSSTNSHVIHHIFPTIPHYQAEEATNAIKPILGDYYHFDDTPFYKALWREAKECIYVEADDQKYKGVLWFKNN